MPGDLQDTIIFSAAIMASSRDTEASRSLVNFLRTPQATTSSFGAELDQKTDFQTSFAKLPTIHPNSSLINGVVCGVRVEEVEDPLMREIRYLDKLIDELAKGRAMGKILRAE